MLKLAKQSLRLAQPILPLGRHLPFTLQQLVIEPALAAVFAAALADGDFDMLRGRWLRLEVSDLGLSWNLTCRRQGLQLAASARPDVVIRGNWREFLLLASRQEDPDTLFFRRRLVIEGDTDLGLAIKNLIDSLDPDALPPRFWHLLRWLGAGAADAELASPLNTSG